MKQFENWLEYLILAVCTGAVALVVFVLLVGRDTEDIALAQYPDDFTTIVEQCGEQAASSVVVSGIAIKSFNSGVFLSCAAQHNVTFELNGDTVKVKADAD